MSKLTPEREAEIRRMLHDNTFGYLSSAVTEVFAELDRVREENKEDPYCSKAKYLDVVKECDQLRAKLEGAKQDLFWAMTFTPRMHMPLGNIQMLRNKMGDALAKIRGDK